MNSRALAYALLRAESESEVDEIVAASNEMSNPKNWTPLDGRETNFNVVTNQAMSGGKAATELMTNMVDAILMRRAQEEGIDPHSEEAPQSMAAARHQLIKEIAGESLINEDDSVLRTYSQKNLIIGFTGRLRGGPPCITFMDNGEGQPPNKFKDTFLSLSKGNKTDIPFVQGKFNMGSSGVLSFCGRHWYKLIVSRRHGKPSDPWGWTLVRRRPGGGTPIAEYFHIGGKIQSFDAPYVHPFKVKSTGEQYENVMLGSGSIVKLYDFQFGKNFREFSVRDAFNENLVDTVLPFRMMDFRWPASEGRGEARALGIDERTINGMEFSLLRSAQKQQDAEDTDEAGASKIFVGDYEDEELGEIRVYAIPVSRDMPGWLKKTNYRVFHSVNGQVQYKSNRGFVSQQCRLPALKDRVVIIVDSSALTFAAHNDVWKGDREHVRETIVGEKYLDNVKDIIRNSVALKSLHEQVAAEELSISSDQQRNELFQQLVDEDDTLADMLSDIDPTITMHRPAPPEKDREGKYSPTFFEITGRRREFELPVNRTLPVSAKTDAVDDYFTRPDNRGRLYTSDPKMKEAFTVSTQMHNGIVTVFFKPTEKAEAGDEFTFELGLVDDALASPVVDRLVIRLTVAKAASKKSPNHKKKKKKKENPTKEKPSLGLPKYVLMTKDGREIDGHECRLWPEDWSDLDGGTIEDLGEEHGKLYQINFDNSYHLKYKADASGELESRSITEKYITGMRLLLLGFERALTKSADTEEWVAERADEIRRMAATGAAQTILALAEKLPKIAVSNPDDTPE